MKYKYLTSLSLFLLIPGIAYSQILNFNDFNGTGKFINAKGGIITSSDNKPYSNVVGNIYVSGDFGEDNYSNIIHSDPIFKTLKFNGDIWSESPLYTIKEHLDPITNEFIFELNRNKFTENLIYEDELAKFLESNYQDTNNRNKNNFYNQLKKINNKDQLNREINTVFGIGVFPTLTRQTFDSINDINNTSLLLISKFDVNSLVGDIKVDSSYRRFNSKNKSINNFSDYEISSNILSFWVEKKVTQEIEIGTIYTLSDSSTKMTKNNTYRDDFYYSGGIYTTYNYDSIIFNSLFSIGGNYNNVDRYNQSSLGDFKNSSTNKNFYLGLNNLVYKKIDFDYASLTPKFEFNITGLHQNKIKENGEFGIQIEPTNNISIKPGIGIQIEKDLYITPIHKFKVDLGVLSYFELGNPYKDLEASSEAFDDETYKIKKYNSDAVETKFLLREGYNFSDKFEITLDESYTISKNQNQFKYGVNFIFIF